MKLIFIHGPAAAGKLTVGRALEDLTGFRLFHNHLVVDTLLSVFPFGTPSFVALREQIWLSVFEAAAKDGISTIFTFAPEADRESQLHRQGCFDHPERGRRGLLREARLPYRCH